MTPVVTTMNFNRRFGHLSSMSVGYVENDKSVHFRFNRWGITSIKDRTGNKMGETGDQNMVAFKLACDLVFKQTGKTRWTQPTKEARKAMEVSNV